jgi:hypothetical protein
MVPCVCSKCRGSEAPYLFDYETLIDAKTARDRLPCLQSFVDVEISELLSGIEFLKNEKSISEKETGVKKIRLFLASSAELKEDREQFEITLVQKRFLAEID